MPQNNTDRKISFMATFGKVMRIIGRQKILLVASLLFAAVSIILQLYIPMLFGDAIDSIIGKNQVNFPLVAALMGRIFLLVIIAAAASWIMNEIGRASCRE